jgi:hypothetical protein
MGSGLYSNPEAVAWLEASPADIADSASWDYWSLEGMSAPQPVTSHDLVEETDVMGDGFRLSQPWSPSVETTRWAVDCGQEFRRRPNAPHACLVAGSLYTTIDAWPAGWDFSYSEEWNRTHATTEPVLAGSGAV